MLAHYQPQPVLLQTTPWTALPAVSALPTVPVVVEVQRMNDNAFFTYNVNVHTPEMACTTVQMSQQTAPAVSAPQTLLALPQDAQAMTPNMNGDQTNIVDKNQYFHNQNLCVNSDSSTSERLSENCPTKEYAFPQELKSLFRLNTCGLCNTFMRSMRNAVDHYASRAHDRRVNVWLMRNLNKRSQISNGAGDFYCEICDLKFTSFVHANQHFLGRRHRLVVNHAVKPNGSGYYDGFGNWVHTNGKYQMCPLCDVTITSATQMALHMAGSKHKRKTFAFNSKGMGINGSHVYLFNADGSLQPLNPNGIYFLPCIQQNDNFDKYVDMNAMFYCEACEASLNHLKSVKQHENGKKHRKNVAMLRCRKSYIVNA